MFNISVFLLLKGSTGCKMWPTVHMPPSAVHSADFVLFALKHIQNTQIYKTNTLDVIHSGDTTSLTSTKLQPFSSYYFLENKIFLKRNDK